MYAVGIVTQKIGLLLAQPVDAISSSRQNILITRFVISIVSQLVLAYYLTIPLVNVITVSKNRMDTCLMLFPLAYDIEHVLTVKRILSHSLNDTLKHPFLGIFMEIDDAW